ncbi:MAG: B12-binding domain-containing radical SAM protein [Spirochaetales bacterium]|nr:B12-binding domain-containing radical SAM protein [Spirochaetales bacterium]
MKITFILPAIGRKKNKQYIKSWAVFPPVAFGILKALTPPEIEIEFIDDRKDYIDFSLSTDCVALSVESCTAKRAYYIAEQFRGRRIPVIIGGSQATFIPGEVQNFCDAVYIGNAEDKWREVLADLDRGKLKKKYVAAPGFSTTVPDNTIFKNNYAPISLIESARGCYFDCAICSIARYYKKQFFPRPIESIVKEFKASPNPYIFLLDDNLIARREFTIELLQNLRPLKKKWISQASIQIACDEKLLDLAYRAGCRELFIGFESLDESTLASINKKWSLSFGKLDDLVKKIHNHGISIYANFVFGFDQDTLKSFDDVYEFSHRHSFQMVGYNTLLPYPNTAIYNTLLKHGRMTHPRWWLDPDFQFGDIPFIPKNMTKEQLIEKSRQLRLAFYNPKSIFKRAWHFISHGMDPGLSIVALFQYLMMGREVNNKLNIPLGENLDSAGK